MAAAATPLPGRSLRDEYASFNEVDVGQWDASYTSIGDDSYISIFRVGRKGRLFI